MRDWLNIREWCKLLPIKDDAFSRVFESLSYRDYNRYFWGQIISQTGTWMQQVAMSWLIYNLTGSVVLLGTVVFLAQIPILFFTPFSSVLADRYDRRRLLILTQILAMIQAALLAIMVFTHTTNVPMIMLLSFMLGCVNSLDMPTRQSFYPLLVPIDKLNNAIALNSTIINGSRLVGPAAGGMLIDWVGEGGCFLLNAISFLFVIAALYTIRCKQPLSEFHHHLLNELREGIRYVLSSSPICILLLTVVSFSFCGFNVATFLPAYVKDTLHGSSTMLGFVLTCNGVGAVAAALYLATRKGVVGLARVVVIGMLMTGMSMAILFFIHTIWLTIPVVIFLGFGLICTIASLNTLLQTLLKSNMRGRVMGYYSMAFIGCSALGSLSWSHLSTLLTLPWTMFVGGVCCIISALLFGQRRVDIEATKN